MKEFLIPFSILLIAFLVYFSFIGKGAFFLPTKEMVPHQKGQVMQYPVASGLPDATPAGSEGYTLESIFKAEHSLPVRSG